MIPKIFSYLDEITDSYKEPVTRITGLQRNPKDIIRTIEFYSNDQYLSGNKDSLGREKPFYNVGNYRVNTAKVATDVDIKDLRYEADSLNDVVPTMLINHELFKVLKEMNFSETLNDGGKTRPKYGGLLLKKSMTEGKLNIDVVDWLNVDFDPGDVIGGTIIETFYLQPSELAMKNDSWDAYEMKEFKDAHFKAHKNKPVKYEIKEVSGEMPESFHTDYEEVPGKEVEYMRMCFYIGIVNKKKFLLYVEHEKEINFKYLSWEKVGLSLGRGVWEEGFESQVWTNDGMITLKNASELFAKILIKTDSQRVQGNAITGVDHGHIFQLEKGADMNVMNMGASKLPELQNIIALWKQQYDSAVSTYDANTGEAPTAGTPYSQTALLNQVANSPFEYQREVLGIFLNEVLNDWILPYLKKRILKKHYLVSEFSDEDLKMIDESIMAKEVNNAIKDILFQEALPSPVALENVSMSVDNNLAKLGKRREIDIPEDFLDVEGKITANITGELKNKSAMMQSLDSIFKTVVSTFNPNTGQYGALQDPVLSKIFASIVEMSGVPISSAQLKPSTTTQPPQPSPMQQPSPSPMQQPDLSAIEQAPTNG